LEGVNGISLWKELTCILFSSKLSSTNSMGTAMNNRRMITLMSFLSFVIPAVSFHSPVHISRSPPVGWRTMPGFHQVDEDSRTHSSRSTALNFMGSDGGILGIGTPELFTILLVGYFILGPSDLYKLTKEIGNFVQSIRSLGTEASKTFETSMESQLQLDEIRKAQRELNEAFSFRRSINTDGTSAAFENESQPVMQQPVAETVAATASAPATATDSEPVVKKKKKRRRVVKKKQSVEVPAEPAPVKSIFPDDVESSLPDLDMYDAFPANEPMKDKKAPKTDESPTASSDWFADDANQTLPSLSSMVGEEMDWLSSAVDESKSEPTLSSPAVPSAVDNQRFQAQLSGSWNDQVMQNEDSLAPLGMIMERLAILEEEKQAADCRLEEEFKSRTELEEKFYREKRKLLEESAATVQSEAYLSPIGKT